MLNSLIVNIFVVSILGGKVFASELDYWKFVLESIQKTTKSEFGSCRESDSNTPVNIFNHIDQDEVHLCIKEICGDLNSTQAVLGNEIPVQFEEKYRSKIESAVKNIEVNENNLMAVLNREIKSQRNFSQLSDEEKIIASIAFLNNADHKIIDKLSDKEQKRLASLFRKSEMFYSFYNQLFIQNKVEAQNLSLDEIQSRSQELSSSMRSKYSRMRLWPELENSVKYNEYGLKMATVANSDYYIQNAREQFAYIKTVDLLLSKKDMVKKTLVNLGTPGKDFPSLKSALSSRVNKQSGDVRSAITACARTSTVRQMNLPTSDELRAIQENVETVKKKISEKFLSTLSAHSRAVLDQVLRNTQINLPPSKESYELAFEAKLESLAEMSYAQDQKNTRVATIYDFHTTGDFISYMQEDCEYGILKEGDDHARAGFEQINLSEIVNNKVKSSGLIAHELFHVLDPDLSLLNLSSESTKAISTIKSCLKDMHNNGSFYLTEDWADLGGALVTADSNTNSYCASIQKWGLSFSFNSKDTHSPSLFRLLHYQSYKTNGLPNSCQKILSRQVPPVLIRPCFGSR